ncbi:MAG TPA: calcium incorporation protein MxaA [Burkholderiales bacterium]
MRTAIAWAWLALVACLSAGPTGAQELPAMPIDKPRLSGPPPNATIEQPRPFGHVVGDVLTQHILLQLDGRPFSPAPLPRPERVSNWLERRELRIVAGDDGRRWLEAEFQIINAPTSLTPTVIPAWELPSASGQSALRMPEWPISIAPLIPQTATGEDVSPALRPDRAAPTIATRDIERQLALFAGACVATFALWVGWWLWRQWRAASTQPFARAWRAMRRLDDGSPQAWYALHRSFDETAGEALRATTLARLFQQAPHLTPLREQIERFFAQSNERFFGTGQVSSPFPVRKLCGELRRLEKRHEA